MTVKVTSYEYCTLEACDEHDASIRVTDARAENTEVIDAEVWNVTELEDS